MTNREFGSDFHYIGGSQWEDDGPSSLFQTHDRLYFSGRAALFAIIQHGIGTYSWRKLYVPTYYCLEVYDFIQSLNIEIEYYDYNPLCDKIETSIVDLPNHVLLCVNYFGIHTPDASKYKSIVTIEDVTHALGAINQSKANFVFGSLRKTLPIPVGGFVKVNYLNTILPLPTYNPKAEEIALEKLCAMVLKKKYLWGTFRHKLEFRDMYTKAEDAFRLEPTNAAMPDFSGAMLMRLNHEYILRKKRENSAHIKKLILHSNAFELLSVDSNVEFACILKFKRNADRENMRKILLENNVFPAILWPGQTRPRDKQFADTTLMVHIDFRYDTHDMEFIASIINRFANA